MEYVYLLQASEEQVGKLYKLLDSVLKKDGVEALQDVVDLYNILASASKIPVKPTEEPKEAESVPTSEPAAINPPEVSQG